MIGELLGTLAKHHPDVLAGLASMTAGAAVGGATACGVTSLAAGTATGTSLAVGAGSCAYALGGGATAAALEGGIAVAIGSGASATAVGSIAVAIAPAVLAGMGVGALIGLLVYLVYRYVKNKKGKRD